MTVSASTRIVTTTDIVLTMSLDHARMLFDLMQRIAGSSIKSRRGLADQLSNVLGPVVGHKTTSTDIDEASSIVFKDIR